MKELEKFQEDAVKEGLHLQVVADDIWQITFNAAPGTIYEGEVFTLRVRFTDDYPMDSPEVVFIPPAPVHSHIYSNGHICLNILGDDWSPALTVRSVCLSILSMMSSATVKVLPHDNDSYTRVPRAGGPKQTRFSYHDDSV